MKYSDRKRHKNRIKRSGQARLVHVKDITSSPREGELAGTTSETSCTYKRKVYSYFSGAVENSIKEHKMGLFVLHSFTCSIHTPTSLLRFFFSTSDASPAIRFFKLGSGFGPHVLCNTRAAWVRKLLWVRIICTKSGHPATLLSSKSSLKTYLFQQSY